MKTPLKPSKEILQLLKFIKHLGIEYHVIKNASFHFTSSARIPTTRPLTNIKAWKIFLCLDGKYKPKIKIQQPDLWLLYSLAHELGHVLTPLYFNDPSGALCGYGNRLGWYGSARILNENMAWNIGKDILMGLFGKRILKYYNETAEECLQSYINELNTSTIKK